MDIEKTAVELLRCTLSWEVGSRVIGDVTALDLAVLAASVVGTCPTCGATAWVNTDCEVCRMCSQLLDDTPCSAPHQEHLRKYGVPLLEAGGTPVGWNLVAAGHTMLCTPAAHEHPQDIKEREK